MACELRVDEPGQGVPGAGRHDATRAGSAPASRTTRGSSAPTASTPRSPPSRPASSRRRSRTCARCGRSATCVNGRSGKVVHEVTPDGAVYFGANDEAGNTDETVEVPERRRAALAVDRRQRFPGRDVRLHRPEHAVRDPRSTRTATAGRRGSATSSARAWVRRSSTTRSTRSVACATWPTWPAAGTTGRPRRGPGQRADQMEAAVRAGPGGSARTSDQYADSLDGPGQREGFPAALDRRDAGRGRAGRPGRPIGPLASDDHARDAARTSANRPATPDRTGCSTPAPGRPAPRAASAARAATRRSSTVQSERVVFSLNTAIMAVGRGQLRPHGPGPAAALHHGRTRAIQLDPALWEMPGAMPEIAPGGDFGREHRQAVHRAVDGAAGLGRVRRALAGGPPAARRVAGPRPEPRSTVVPRIPDGQSRDRRAEHPARNGQRRRVRRPGRELAGHDRQQARAGGADDRRGAAERRERPLGADRRADREVPTPRQRAGHRTSRSTCPPARATNSLVVRYR